MTIEIKDSYLYWVKYSLFHKEYIMFTSDEQRDCWVERNQYKFGKVELKDIIKIIKHKEIHVCTLVTLKEERELLTKIWSYFTDGN